MIARKKNIAGYTDERGVFRPIRKPSYVGKAKRKATTKDRKKYSRAKAGDLGKAKQERALEDVFQREIRLQKEEREHKARVMKQIERETLGDSTETTRGRTLVEFVRGQGGIKPGYKFGGKKNRGKRVSYDAGELAPLTYKESGKRGLVSDKGKKSLDGMFQAAREAGYDVADMDDLIGRMDKEIRGDKATYATRGYIDYRDNPKLKRKNPINIFGVVAAVSGVQSALQIKEMLKKKPARRKSRVVSNPSGRTTAKRANPQGTTSGERYYEKLFDQDLAAIEDGNFRLIRSAQAHGKLAGYGKAEIDQLVQRARLAHQLKEMYRAKENPKTIAAELSRLQTATKLLGSRRKNGGRSIKRNPVGWFREVSPVTADAIKKLYRGLAAKYHPDKGGDTRTMQEINADYSKAMKIAISGEGNESRAKAETAAIEPLREAIEFAVTLPDDVKVVIRGLWLWIEGNTYKAKDQIKSFTSSDGKRFKWASQKKAWFFAAVPSSNRRGEMSFSGIEALHGRQDVTDRKRRPSLNPKRVAGAKKAVARSPKSNPERCLRCRKMTSEGTWDINVGFCNPCKAKQRKARKNPTRPPRSRTFESFNGRPVTNATRRPVSRHAPAKLAQLGDLIEIKLIGGHVLTPNPSRYKLTAANGKLWIAGGKFAKPNPAAKVNEINPLGEIDHVVYRTHKPHHGDAPNTHYIHKLGEETGHRPLLCVDKEGFPVIRGGKYKIEARGIVN